MTGQLADAGELADEIVKRLRPAELGEGAARFVRRIATDRSITFYTSLFYLPDEWQLHYTAFPDGSLDLQIFDQEGAIVWQHRLRPARHA